MRYSTVALAASLLVKDTVLAGTMHGHRARHGIQARDVTVTDEVSETSTIYEYVTVDWPGDSSSSSAAASSTAEPTTTTIQIMTVSSTSTVPSSTSTSASAAAAASASALEADVLLAHSSSSQTTFQTVAKSTTSSTPVAATTTAAPIASTTSTSAATSATTSASSTSSTSSGKRGLPYNTASLVEAFLSCKAVTWAYNWGSSSDGLTSDLMFVPMLWGLSSTFTSGWSAAATSAIASGSTALLAFNEPDLAAQSNIGYADAAAGYLEYMQPFAGKAKLGSPAVTNGAAPMGLTYLANFISACSTCTIDFCAIHWYDSASNVDYFKSYMAEAQTACGGKPIWITEFGASGTDDEVATFLDTVIPWLDEQSYIEKYAYFMASDSVMLSGTSLSTIGEAFVSA